MTSRLATDRWRALTLVMALVATLSMASARAEAQVSPQDANGCNVNVCIFLTGSGTTVTQWRTTGGALGYNCGYGYFWRNGSLVKSIYACGSGTVAATWNSPGTFSHGDQLCNSWSIASGYPCKTIYN